MTEKNRNMGAKTKIPASVENYVDRSQFWTDYEKKKISIFHAGAGFGKSLLMDLLRMVSAGAGGQ